MEFAERVGYPCLLRPSFILSGSAMNVAYNAEELKLYLTQAVQVCYCKIAIIYDAYKINLKKQFFSDYFLNRYFRILRRLKNLDALRMEIFNECLLD